MLLQSCFVSSNIFVRANAVLLCFIHSSVHTTRVFVSAGLTQVAPGFGKKIKLQLQARPNAIKHRNKTSAIVFNLALGISRRERCSRRTQIPKRYAAL